MPAFTFSPSHHVPFRDVEVLERVRKIKREDITKHPNPDFRIRVIPDADFEILWTQDIFARIKRAADEDRKVVLILPSPYPGYRYVAWLINICRVNCRHLHTFIMDEYADEHGNVAPESWPQGFMHSFKEYFYGAIDPDLRPPEDQVHGPTTENVNDYSKMIADAGGADVCYSGPGWTGHTAFVEPDAPEFAAADLDEWKTMGSRIATLSPFTLAQNSLHGSFGMSGDLAAVPPKAATIGPVDVLSARLRIQAHALQVHGTATSWQRLITRLVLHGPVTRLLPESVCQLARTDVWVSETSARNIEPDWSKGY
jgi:6-phosphogluconolactonase/glucosamine-6-phosphate isomerase/deaminase